MLTIQAEIKKQEQKLDGRYNVKLWFTLGRKIKRLSTSLFATSKTIELPIFIGFAHEDIKKVPLDILSRGTLNKTAATYSPTSTQYHRRDGA